MIHSPVNRERSRQISLSASGSCVGQREDEELAYTFVEKAARKALPSAEFAMGYYTEVGVGG
jgi:hypothetical protein